MPNRELFARHLDNKIKKVRNAYLNIDAKYHDIVDELVEKLKDIDSKFKPDFNFKYPDFLNDWEIGVISSGQVLKIIEGWNFDEVAETTLTRRLNNFAIQNEEVEYLIRFTVNQIKQQVVPLYKVYLQDMLALFRVAHMVDTKQIPVTWLEIRVAPDGNLKSLCEDMTLNQTVRQIDHYVLKYISQKMYLGENVVCLQEEENNQTQITHWIFAPKSYIDFLKKTYDVKEALDMDGDVAYVKKIIGDYV